ncbi:mitochondrial RNA ligase 2 [Perkinsela sp. CCAP 1560/4]|nr:mitochondrial RNA ligase 2 [Perkinsela sp. CCAP 1560/4]|eukprot:KNH08036.1 mitochondrial RNA ligase 2 [Perkinsela sp. CCAP 1560/4]
MQYNVSVTAWREALYGTRLRGLVQNPPQLVITSSSMQPLITVDKERSVEMSGWHFKWPIRYYMTPVNLPHEQRLKLMEQRQKDLYRRHAWKGNVPGQLSNVSNLTKITRDVYEADSSRDWQPTSVYKPLEQQMGGKYQRGWGYRNPDKKVVGETLGGKGLGWKRKLSGLWQIVPERIGYSPNRGY